MKEGEKRNGGGGLGGQMERCSRKGLVGLQMLI